MPSDEFLAVTWGGDDRDGVGRLTVTASASGFSGQSSAWFDRIAVEEFAEALAVFPLSADGPSISGGYGGDEPQTHVELRAYPVGVHGQIAIGVSLATPVQRGERLDGKHHVHLELPTTYERIKVFSRDLGRITSSNGQQAAIDAERLMP